MQASLLDLQSLSSVGGSAKQARDRRFQAILPLRGKILNVERQDDASLYKNNEISNLIVGLGLGLKGEASPNLRYGKVGRWGCRPRFGPHAFNGTTSSLLPCPPVWSPWCELSMYCGTNMCSILTCITSPCLCLFAGDHLDRC